MPLAVSQEAVLRSLALSFIYPARAIRPLPLAGAEQGGTGSGVAGPPPRGEDVTQTQHCVPAVPPGEAQGAWQLVQGLVPSWGVGERAPRAGRVD